MDQWPDSDDQNPSKTYALSGKIMLASIISLFILVVFLVLLHLYSRWYLHRRNPNPNPTQHHPNRSIRILYYNGSASPPPTGGLHTSVLNSLPLFVHSPEKDANSPECAVCLSEFENGEKGRILPNCKHKFHTGCIDMWFFSNSTCPLCRSPVEPVETEMTGLAEPGSSTSFTETRRKRVDVRIDVPNRDESVSESEFRQPSPSVALRSPGSRLLSLKRIISMVSPSSSGVGTSCVPVAATESDLESAGQESSRG